MMTKSFDSLTKEKICPGTGTAIHVFVELAQVAEVIEVELLILLWKKALVGTIHKQVFQ